MGTSDTTNSNGTTGATGSAAAHVDSLVTAAHGALRAFLALSQEQIDHIVKKASVAAAQPARPPRRARPSPRPAAACSRTRPSRTSSPPSTSPTRMPVAQDRRRRLPRRAQRHRRDRRARRGRLRPHARHEPDVHDDLQGAPRAQDPQPDRLRFPSGRPAVHRRRGRAVVRDAAVAAGRTRALHPVDRASLPRGDQPPHEPSRASPSSSPPAAARWSGPPTRPASRPSVSGAGNVPAFIERTAKLRARRARHRGCRRRSTTA